MKFICVSTTTAFRQLIEKNEHQSEERKKRNAEENKKGLLGTAHKYSFQRQISFFYVSCSIERLVFVFDSGGLAKKTQISFFIYSKNLA